VRGTVVEAYATPNGEGIPRLGVVIGRRVASRAVDRNRCKRHVRELFREVQSQLVGLDIVLRFRAPWNKRGLPDLRLEISELLSAVARCRN
jgi:ribonuclease P protein component